MTKTYRCEEMMCDHCVSRIHGALEEAGLPHKVDLSAKTVSVDGEESDFARAVELLDDLGFGAVEA